MEGKLHIDDNDVEKSRKYFSTVCMNKLKKIISYSNTLWVTLLWVFLNFFDKMCDPCDCCQVLISTLLQFIVVYKVYDYVNFFFKYISTVIKIW